MKNSFPEDFLKYPDMQNVTIEVERFQKFVRAVQMLERARTDLEFNRGWIEEAVSTGNVIQYGDKISHLVNGLEKEGWKDGAASALFLSLAYHAELQKAVADCFPEASKQTPEKTIDLLVKGCQRS
ncbi:MAG: hypothetical protein QG650_229 [Patescibacteria group bacterium]|nr:hypothetical protein [Patescibacteria group bacterium]